MLYWQHGHKPPKSTRAPLPFSLKLPASGAPRVHTRVFSLFERNESSRIRAAHERENGVNVASFAVSAKGNTKGREARRCGAHEDNRERTKEG